MRRQVYVLHVRPRTEKKVFTFLERYGFWRLLPCWTKVTKIQRRKVRRELPLFPGYVFACLGPDERRKMLETNLLVGTIPVPRPRELVHQLRQVMRALRGQPDLRPAPVFREGTLVRIDAGPLRGVEGRVKRAGADATLVLNVDMLGQAVEVSVNPADLVPVA